MKHYGDIQKIDGHKVPLVDIITAGSPCQDLSIAGIGCTKIQSTRKFYRSWLCEQPKGLLVLVSGQDGRTVESRWSRRTDNGITL